VTYIADTGFIWHAGVRGRPSALARDFLDKGPLFIMADAALIEAGYRLRCHFAPD